MLRVLSLIIISILCFHLRPVYAVETIQILVLPFEIHAPEKLEYLQSEIPKIVAKRLKEDGAIIIDKFLESDMTWKQKIKSSAQIRNLGIETDADYVVWGSLTWIGKKFSLDVKAIRSFGQDFPASFFVEGEGMENLIVKVRAITVDIGMKLFNREKIAEIRISGNKRIEDDAIARVIKTKPGDVYLPKSLSKDLKTVYSMGYFDDIRITLLLNGKYKRRLSLTRYSIDIRTVL